MFTDTHAHLYASQFKKDRDKVIQRAIEEGVDQLYLPNIDTESIGPMYELIDQYPQNCFPMMGIHPCSIKENYKEELAAAATELEKGERKFYAIGEIGLDFYWDVSFKKQQEEALRTQIEWAKKYQLPIVLHCRESISETIDIVEEMNDEQLTGIFHCFGGTIEQAERIIQLGGFYMGIGGVVTYKKTNLGELLQNIDLKHLVLETDAPYLAPEPYRSSKKRRNESAYIVNIAAKLAEIKGLSMEEIGKVTSENAQKVFQRI